MVRVFIDSSIAPATARVYATSQRWYLAFCRSSRLTPLPTSEHQLCLYVAHLASGGLQHSSIKGYLSAIRRLQIVCGLGDLFAASWPLLECTLKGVKREQAKRAVTRPRPRLPVTPAILRLLRQFWEREQHNPDHIMLWAACCTCFFGFLRSGEITVPSAKEYDAGCHLSEGDVALDCSTAPSAVQVKIKASKIDPFRKVYLGMTFVQWGQ